MAREAGVSIGNETESLQLIDDEGMAWEYLLPLAELNSAVLDGIQWEL